MKRSKRRDGGTPPGASDADTPRPNGVADNDPESRTVAGETTEPDTGREPRAEDDRRGDTRTPCADRRQGTERRGGDDRRTGQDRRGSQDRREPGDRRSGHDRRRSDRRARDVGPPSGVPERRGGTDRRASERRSGRDRRDETGWAALQLDHVVVEPLAFEDELVAAARGVRWLARARYSGFQVGAALETIDGHIITGCNIENASYGLTICAERVALVKALSEGHEVFTRIAIVTAAGRPTTPCGACRQLLWEYCGDIQVILASPTEVVRRHQLGRLLPAPFDHTSLE